MPKTAKDDVSYLLKRALEEQVAARNACCPSARARHDQLATLYRFRAAMLSTKPLQWAAYLVAQEPAAIA